MISYRKKDRLWPVFFEIVEKSGSCRKPKASLVKGRWLSVSEAGGILCGIFRSRIGFDHILLFSRESPSHGVRRASPL